MLYPIKLFRVLVIASLLLFSLAGATDTVYELHFFWSKDCEVCHKLLEKDLPHLLRKYPDRLRLVKHEISEDIDAYELLAEFEEKTKSYNNPIPVLFIGNKAFGGEAKIINELPGFVDSLIQKGTRITTASEPSGAKEGFTSAEKAKPVYILYLSEKGCAHCDRVELHLQYLEKIYPNLIVRRGNIESKEIKELNEALCEKFGVQTQRRLVAPSIFFDDTAMIQEEIDLNRIKELVKLKSQTGSLKPWATVTEEELAEARERIKRRFSHFKPIMIITAGLLDGVNPCAFGTIAFFVILLTTLGRKRREILTIGFTFAITVFVVYFLIGLGFLKFLTALSAVRLIGQVIYIAGGGFALLLGGLSLYDFLKSRRGDVKDMILKLPAPIRKRMHTVIIKEEGSRRTHHFIIATVITGFMVSILELACTGQVYLPTIVYVAGEQSLRLKAIFYLIVYNLMFILPLLVVFMIAFLGASSAKLNDWSKKSVPVVKFLTAILFFTLGGLLLRTAIIP